MALTPVEIAHIKLPRLLRLQEGAVDTPARRDRQTFEDVWRERADLTDKVEQLEADLVRYKELETLLRTTLISAERAPSSSEQARREAEVIVEEAHAEARQVARRARRRRSGSSTESADPVAARSALQH